MRSRVERDRAVVMREVEHHDDVARRLDDLEPAARRRARHGVQTKGLRIGVEAFLLTWPSARKSRANLVAPGERPWLIWNPAAGRIGDIRLLGRTADVDVAVLFDVVAAVGPAPRALQVGRAVGEARRVERWKARELFEPRRWTRLLRRVGRIEALRCG